MERRDHGGHGGEPGGIAELRQLIHEHGAALDYDLITKTRYMLRDVGGALPWGALLHFVQFLPRDSAISRELAPVSDVERWTRGDATASILADLFDLVAQFRAEQAVKGSDHKPRRPKAYPRPGVTPEGTRHLGSDPIPVSEFEGWWASKDKDGR